MGGKKWETVEIGPKSATPVFVPLPELFSVASAKAALTFVRSRAIVVKCVRDGEQGSDRGDGRTEGSEYSGTVLGPVRSRTLAKRGWMS